MLEKIKKHKKLMIAIVVIVIIAIVIGILVHRMRQSASEITPGWTVAYRHLPCKSRTCQVP